MSPRDAPTGSAITASRVQPFRSSRVPEPKVPQVYDTNRYSLLSDKHSQINEMLNMPMHKSHRIGAATFGHLQTRDSQLNSSTAQALKRSMANESFTIKSDASVVRIPQKVRDFTSDIADD